jgi:hypothetical protein
MITAELDGDVSQKTWRITAPTDGLRSFRLDMSHTCTVTTDKEHQCLLPVTNFSFQSIHRPVGTLLGDFEPVDSLATCVVDRALPTAVGPTTGASAQDKILCMRKSLLLNNILNE